MEMCFKSVSVLYNLRINDFCVFTYLDIIKNVMFSFHSNNSKNIIMENIW